MKIKHDLKDDLAARLTAAGMLSDFTAEALDELVWSMQAYLATSSDDPLRWPSKRKEKLGYIEEKAAELHTILGGDEFMHGLYRCQSGGALAELHEQLETVRLKIAVERRELDEQKEREAYEWGKPGRERSRLLHLLDSIVQAYLTAHPSEQRLSKRKLTFAQAVFAAVGEDKSLEAVRGLLRNRT